MIKIRALFGRNAGLIGMADCMDVFVWMDWN